MELLPSTTSTAWPLRVAGWGAFLACSWTWCIGMLLPVLLVRDAGAWGWVVFAVPNVLGAAAFAWVLARPGGSERLVQRHGPACAWFSVITIAFHVHFAAWFLARLIGPAAGVLVAAAVAAYWLMGSRQEGRDPWTAAATLLLSLLALALLLARGQARADLDWKPTAAAGWLAPVCLLGFTLCPYLDLTFHRARQSLPRAQAKAAFAIGFGAMFLAMIVFSLLYAGTLTPLLAPGFAEVRLAPAVVWILGVHLVIQTGFTVAMHLRELLTTVHQVQGRFPILLAAVLATLVAHAVLGLDVQRLGLDSGEVLYRGFLGFYGLVFPAYVWVAMTPAGDQAAPGPGAGGRRRRLLVLALTILAAAPFYALGFLAQRWPWLAPGVALVVAAGLAVRLLERRTAA